MRLDLFLVEQKLLSSRQRAKDLIGKGQVYINGQVVTKASFEVSSNQYVEIRGEELAYPSRAGLKLEKALKVFNIDPTDFIVLDVGASTGGFTSCLLNHGAKQVFAVDVGQNQLVSELRDDPRVVVYEKTNIRDLTAERLPALVDLVTVDVSFISLEKVFPSIRTLLKPGGQIVALIKPQFETGGVGLNKQGVITRASVHQKSLPPLIQRLQGDDLGLVAFDFSPISGSKGNLEFLAHFQWGVKSWNATELVETVIKRGWEQKSQGGGKS